MTGRRRDILMGVAAAAAPAPAIARGIKELKMVTDWAKNMVGTQTSAERLARSIAAMSDRKLKVTVYPAGSLVRALETLDAVSAGVTDMHPPYRGEP